MDIIKIDKALVVGLGYRTGPAVSNFLVSKGIDTSVTDIKDEKELYPIIAGLDEKVEIYAGSQEPEILDRGFDIVVLSPGVPKKIPLIREALRRKIPVISEIELAYMFIKGDIIAITGTDGKTTTTSLMGHVLEELGFHVLVGGNIGKPLISIAEKTGSDSVTLIELSSFQLETVKNFRPHISAILNVTPDHLDRYDDMNEYFEAKLRITMNQRSHDFYIYNRDDPMLAENLNGIKAQKLSFSLKDKSAAAYYDGAVVHLKDEDKYIEVIDAHKMQLTGLHNIQNVMAALLMIRSLYKKKKFNADFKGIAEGFYRFPGLEHRMENIGTFKERHFINDSKATTIGSVKMAIESIKGNCILILGGKRKGDDYSRLAESMNGKVRSVILIGESKDEFMKLFNKYNCVAAESIDDAVIKAMQESSEGDVILLSPACASFDMFKSYEERGAAFKESFKKLVKGDLSCT